MNPMPPFPATLAYTPLFTVGTGHFSMSDYLRITGVIGYFLHMFSELVDILKSKRNSLLIVDGKFCRLGEIYHTMSQSAISDHCIPHQNILPFSQDLQINITESFWTVNWEGKCEKNLNLVAP